MSAQDEVQKAIAEQLQQGLPDIPIEIRIPGTLTERHSHFFGFAGMLYKRLCDHGHGYTLMSEDLKGQEWQEVMTIIAESAYDLLYHTFASIPPSFQSAHDDPADCVKDIPDMTEWPEKE